MSTASARVDHGTKIEGQTGADVAKGLDAAQENALLKQQLALSGETREVRDVPPPKSYSATGETLYWIGLIAVGAVLGTVLFRRFWKKKGDAPLSAEEKEEHLADRILSIGKEKPVQKHGAPMGQAPKEEDAHADLLQAAQQARRARDTGEEILTEYTGMTAGEALAKLMAAEAAQPAPPLPKSPTPAREETAKRAQPPLRETLPSREDAQKKDALPARAKESAEQTDAAKPALLSAAQKSGTPSERMEKRSEEQPHFEVRI